MTLVEIYRLFDMKIEEKQDGSMFVNAVRMANGCKKERLMNYV